MPFDGCRHESSYMAMAWNYFTVGPVVSVVVAVLFVFLFIVLAMMCLEHRRKSSRRSGNDYITDDMNMDCVPTFQPPRVQIARTKPTTITYSKKAKTAATDPESAAYEDIEMSGDASLKIVGQMVVLTPAPKPATPPPKKVGQSQFYEVYNPDPSVKIFRSRPS